MAVSEVRPHINYYFDVEGPDTREMNSGEDPEKNSASPSDLLNQTLDAFLQQEEEARALSRSSELGEVERAVYNNNASLANLIRDHLQQARALMAYQVDADQATSSRAADISALEQSTSFHPAVLIDKRNGHVYGNNFGVTVWPRHQSVSVYLSEETPVGTFQRREVVPIDNAIVIPLHT